MLISAKLEILKFAKSSFVNTSTGDASCSGLFTNDPVVITSSISSFAMIIGLIKNKKINFLILVMCIYKKAHSTINLHLK